MNTIQALKESTLVELNTIFEFKLHTDMAYQAIQDFAPEGLSTINCATNTLYRKKDLLPLCKHYANIYLPSLSFQHIVNIFEAFFFDLLRLLLTSETKHISADKKIDVEIVLSSPDQSTLIALIVDRELNELKYKKVKDWFEFLNKILQCSYVTSEEIQRISEIKASRDILVHNSGVVNTTYISKAGLMARYTEGEQLQVTHKYFHDTWELTKKLVQSMCNAALAKCESRTQNSTN